MSETCTSCEQYGLSSECESCVGRVYTTSADGETLACGENLASKTFEDGKLCPEVQPDGTIIEAPCKYKLESLQVSATSNRSNGPGPFFARMYNGTYTINQPSFLSLSQTRRESSCVNNKGFVRNSGPCGFSTEKYDIWSCMSVGGYSVSMSLTNKGKTLSFDTGGFFTGGAYGFDAGFSARAQVSASSLLKGGSITLVGYETLYCCSCGSETPAGGWSMIDPGQPYNEETGEQERCPTWGRSYTISLTITPVRTPNWQRTNELGNPPFVMRGLTQPPVPEFYIHRVPSQGADTFNYSMQDSSTTYAIDLTGRSITAYATSNDWYQNEPVATATYSVSLPYGVTGIIDKQTRISSNYGSMAVSLERLPGGIFPYCSGCQNTGANYL